MNVSTNKGAVLNDHDGVIIGYYMSILPEVTINHTGLMLDGAGLSMRPHSPAQVIIQNIVWNASGATVNAGLTIWAWIVIGASAVVPKTIPAGRLVMGVPAKVVRGL